MTSSKTKKIFNVLWLGEPPSDQDVLVSMLEADDLHIAFNQDMTNPDVLIVLGDQLTTQNAIENAITARFDNNIRSGELILVADKMTEEEKQFFYDSGGSELVESPNYLVSLCYSILRHKKTWAQSNSLDDQLREASEMAMLTMQNSSDLGSIIEFTKRAIVCSDYDALAHCILNALSPFSDSALLEFKTESEALQYCSYGNVDPDLLKLLNEGRSKDRITHFSNAMQFNYEKLVLLIEGLPVDDKERMGRIADNLAILVDIAERFLSSLILEQKSKQELLEKKRFLSTISHELNTPMNAIRGFAKIFSSKSVGEQFDERTLTALSSISTNADLMSRIIEVLVNMNDLDNDNYLVNTQTFNVGEIFAMVSKEFAKAAENKGLQFEIEYNDDLTLESDKKQVFNILYQLVQNAIKYTTQGQVIIKAYQEDETTLFSVEDTGIGISPENIFKLETHIGQLDISQDREHYGLGLGLYYARSIAKQIGASIKVESTLNKGTIFTLVISKTLTDLNIGNTEQSNEPTLEDDIFF